MSALETYSDLKLICDKLEKVAIKRGKKGDRVSLQVAGLNSMESLVQLLDATENAAKASKGPGGPLGSAGRSSPERVHTPPPATEEELVELNTRDWYRTWNETTPGSKPCVEDWEAEWNTPGRSFGFDVSIFESAGRDAEEAMRDLLGLEPDEDLAEGWDKCFGCDLRFKFAFQLQPVNLLAGLDDLLGKIEQAIDFWKGYADPLNFLVDFCKLWDLFSQTRICIQDWIAILLAIQGLMAKYATMAISISFDWTVLFGPLLKLILDAISAMIEQIVQLLTAPIDCAIGVLTTIQELLDEIVDTANTAVAFGQSFGNMSGSASAQKMDIAWEGGAGSGGADMRPKKDGAGEQGWIPSFSQDSEFADGPIEGSPPSMTVNRNTWGGISSETGKTGEPLNTRGDGEFGLPTGFKMKAGQSLEEAMKDPKFPYARPFDKIIMMLNDAKAWLTKLFSNILFSLKSLSGLVGGGISLNLQSIGMMMLLIDIYNVVRLLMALGEDEKPCEENIEELAERMRAIYPNFEFTPNSSGNIGVSGDGYDNEIPLPPRCGSPRDGDPKDPGRPPIERLEP